jgi:hypothetical protein
VTVCRGGTKVKVANAVGLFVGMESVGVAVASIAAPCVDMTLSVSAAAVYKEFKVAAGWGA